MGKILELRTLAELNRFIEYSHRVPGLLLKHSTRCPVSAGVLRRFQAFSKASAETGLVFGLIRVIEDRSLSNQVANHFGILHQSPQLLLISKGRVLWHESQGGITDERIAEAVRRFFSPL